MTWAQRRLLKRVALILHDQRCKDGRWCIERRGHARTSATPLASRIVACTSRGDVLDILHEQTCREQIMRSAYPAGCQQVRAHAVALASTPYVARLLDVAQPR